MEASIVYGIILKCWPAGVPFSITFVAVKKEENEGKR